MARFASLRVALLVSAASLSALLCVIAATGLLYLLRPVVSGLDAGVVGDALPLDELPGHAGVSIALFVLIWAAVGVGVAASRRRRADRHLVLFASALWFWEFAGTTVSLAVVRQEAVLRAALAALSVAAVYLAPLVAVTAAVLTSRLLADRDQAPHRLRSQAPFLR